MSLGFCSRCWNYVDFCDCVNFDFSCEDDFDPSIPAPPEDPAPEVGTVWYFLVPIKDVSLYFESNGVEKVGLQLLLMQESLWTIAPPPGDEALYLSVPVDRLPTRDPGFTNSTYNKYVHPWEFNFFNYNGPPIEKIANLAAEILQCNSKRTAAGRKACKLFKMAKSLIDGFKVEEIPIPPGLEESILNLLATGPLTPEQLLLLLTTLVPIELLQKVNDSAITAIDYDWVHRHLVNTLDPDIGYENKKQPYKDCLAENDIFCQQGSYPFPLPSESVDMGDPDFRTMQRPKPNKPPCDRWCQYLKNPRVIINHGNRPPYAALKAFPDPVTGMQDDVPKWVQDLINAELAKGNTGQVKNPPSQPDPMDEDDPKQIELEASRNILRERGGTYTLVSADTGKDAGKWFVAKFHKGVKLPQHVYDQIVKARADIGYTGGEQFPPEIMNDWKPRAFESRSAQRTVTPVFSDILLYDDEDDQEYFFKKRIFTIDEARTSLPYTYNSLPPTYPVVYNIVTVPGVNVTANDGSSCFLHDVLANGNVKTYLRTNSSNYTGNVLPSTACFVLPAHGNARPICNFKWISGSKNLGIFQNGNLAAGPANGSNIFPYITIGFSTTPGVLVYDDFVIWGNGVDSLWEVEWDAASGAGVPGLSNFKAEVIPISNVAVTPVPSVPGVFVQGTRYTSNLIFRSNPLFQFPIGVLFRKSLNILSISPNSNVVPGTIGYANSQFTNTLGSIYLPYRIDTVPNGSIVSNQISFETNSNTEIIGIVSYPIQS